MSTASPLVLPHDETSALKQQVTDRLREHRQRRVRALEAQPMLPIEGLTPHRRNSHVADSVAARFSKSISYREFLQQEAEAAVAQAAAVAEVARRNAEAVAFVQQELIQEMEWETAPLASTVQVVAEADAETGPAPAQHHDTIASKSADSAEGFSQAADAEDVAYTFEEWTAQAVSPEPAVSIPANLIEFPRQLVAARRARPRFAEGPLRDEADAAPQQAQLRIFEVESSAVSTTPTVESVLPEWHDIRLDASSERGDWLAQAEVRSSSALPLHVAPVELRAMAAIVDGCCVATAFLLAVAVTAYASPVLPTGILAVISAAGALFVFALLYLLLFFTLDDATPGMRYARIGFCTFADENPTRASIRRRIVAMLLAALPLGLGLIWACMDEEGLGWHDRITRMYPRAY